MKYNPYKYGMSMIYHRLMWDLKLESWRSRKKIKSYKNKYKGKKAIIVCNGPSLLKTDFSLLDNVFTFGLNKINLLFDKNSFRPSCIVAVNPFVVEQNKDFFSKTKIPLFIDSKSHGVVKNNKEIMYLHSSIQRVFSETPEISLYQGHTVTFVAMQLAYYFGFTEVGLIGCDHNFATKGKANLTVVSEKEDPNHFDKNYFAGGVKWQLPDLFESEVAYTMAKNIFEENNRKIINCTEGGKLDVFERRNLANFIEV